MHRVAVCVAAIAALTAAVHPPAAASVTRLLPPVDAPIARPFHAPHSEYGAGHRGIDYEVPSGTAVRAAAPGRVVFAGAVAGFLAVTIEHGHGLQTTYSRLAELEVGTEDWVETGAWIGRSGSAHGTGGGLHFATKLQGRYVDPLAYLIPLDVSGAIHLVPAEDGDAGGCEDAPRLVEPSAPNDNVAVAIAGIGSKTRGGIDAAVYERTLELLGYPSSRIYRFSYRGVAGRSLHVPYERTDTYGDIREAARKLRELLLEVARRHPRAGVDLIAHSQGGIVARTFLQQLPGATDPRLPRVEHLVTFASPHRGAPLASVPAALDDETLLGDLVLDWVSWWSRREGPVPDPRSAAIAQLAPDSPLVARLAREDIVFGTRALSLAMPNDLIVPADRAQLRDELNRVVGGSDGWLLRVDAHRRLPTAPRALALAHAFLRDAKDTCENWLDRWGPRLGWAIGTAQGQVARAWSTAERWLGRTAIGRAGRLAASGWRLVRSAVARRW